MEPRLRASSEQFYLLIEFMESHGDLSKPQPGLQGRLRCDRLWRKLTEMLNSMGGCGVNKTADKWKKVWSDWKTNTKKKASIINKDIRGTSGTPGSVRPLNRIEERVLRVMGVTVTTGDLDIQEAGFDEPCQPQGTQQSTDTAERVPSPVDEKKSPVSPSPSTPRPHRIRQRRPRQTPFDRATSDFVAIEENRLRLERDRDARLYEIEKERLSIEAQRIQLDRERLQVEAERVRVEEGRNRIEAELRDSIQQFNLKMTALMLVLETRDLRPS